MSLGLEFLSTVSQAAPGAAAAAGGSHDGGRGTASNFQFYSFPMNTNSVLNAFEEISVFFPQSSSDCSINCFFRYSCYCISPFVAVFKYLVILCSASLWILVYGFSLLTVTTGKRQ